MELRVESQELIDFVTVFTIDFYLIEEREINIEVSLDVLLNLGIIPRFLTHKLVGRKS